MHGEHRVYRGIVSVVDDFTKHCHGFHVIFWRQVFNRLCPAHCLALAEMRLIHRGEHCIWKGISEKEKWIRSLATRKGSGLSISIISPSDAMSLQLIEDVSCIRN